jgi:hypothetical protein
MNILERRFMRQTYKITFFSVELYPPSPTPCSHENLTDHAEIVPRRLRFLPL